MKLIKHVSLATAILLTTMLIISAFIILFSNTGW